MLLVTGAIVLISRYTGNRDIILGVPVVKQAIEGEFINTVLTLRIFLKKQATFKELLLLVRKTLIKAAENQNYPIEALLYDLGLTFSETRFPLFDIVVLLQNIHDKTYIRHIPVNSVFSFLRTEEGMEGFLEYNSLLYRKTTIDRIIGHLKHLLRQGLNDVEILVEDMEILSEAERNQLVMEFNHTCSAYPREKSIHELFEQEVTQYPDHIALLSREKQVTYNRLNQEANWLARHLMSKGIGVEAIVGLMLERSLEMVIGMLATLKSGAAYLPIDTEYPRERVQYMLRDSGVPIVLTQRRPGNSIQFCGQLFYLDEGDLDSHSPGHWNRKSKTNSNHIAYVIYTSGTTGKPRGVMIENRSIVNTLVWRKNHYKFNQRDIVLQVPSFSFDSSVEDIFTPLISGAKLVLLPHQYQFDPDYLSELTTKNSITHFLMVPVFYGTFLEGGAERLKHVKTITIAGDSFTPGLVKLHFERLKGVRLFNEYGPTENSVCSTIYEFSPGRSDILIGKPIHNVCCYIVDGKGNLTPLGVPGELWLSGAGLARGYLNNPELTSEKFINYRLQNTNDNKKVPGKRIYHMSYVSYIYKTGDLVRWLEGNIEFLGRLDQQVKIRGFRVEPGEIENRLLQHPGITGAVVVPREDRQGNKYLCAFIVIASWAAAGSELSAAEIIEHLGQRLPDHMIPAHFVEVREIPLTPNGKVDRKKLSKMQGSIASDTRYAPPRNEIEKRLAEIWKNELGLEKVGIYDNYFNVGGDSIKSIRLVHIINHAFHKELKIVDLYINNTIEKLAAKLMKQLSPGPGEDAYRLEVLQEVDALKKRVLKGE
jgi:amino acid adenylation domain-containing protein